MQNGEQKGDEWNRNNYKYKNENMIYEIRGKQAMLDFDLARIYKCKNGTKSINLAVKRHIKRFPERFMFQLSKEEYFKLRFQIETATMNRTLPYAFTEQGVAMLSSILRTDVAESVSVAIMDAFVAMRKYISNNLLEQRYINNLVLEHDNDIKLLKETFSKFDNISNEIFYEGQIYDAYSLLLDIFNSSKESIVIIDNYAYKGLFDLLAKTKKKVLVYSKNIDDKLSSKYQKQYHNVELKYNNSFHDRYIIIDYRVLYHCGSSFKDLGKKCFSINKIDNLAMINDILDRL